MFSGCLLDKQKTTFSPCLLDKQKLKYSSLQGKCWFSFVQETRRICYFLFVQETRRKWNFLFVQETTRKCDFLFVQETRRQCLTLYCLRWPANQSIWPGADIGNVGDLGIPDLRPDLTILVWEAKIRKNITRFAGKRKITYFVSKISLFLTLI